MNTSFFGELLQTISERGRALLARDRRGEASARSENLVELCEDLLSGRGEASGVALAREILGRYATLTTGPRIAFFRSAGASALVPTPRAWSRPSPPGGESFGCNRRRSPCRFRTATAGAVSQAQSCAGRHRRAGAHARATDGFPRPSAEGSGRSRCRFRPSVLVLVQSRLSRASSHRLVDARDRAGKNHPLRGRARDPRLGRFAATHRSAGSPLLRLLSSRARG